MSLTSYFGKTFARLEELRAFNYERWLVGQIRANAFDPENPSVVETRSANVFDHELKAPYIHSLLAANFRMITTKDAIIYLDYAKASDRFTPELVKAVENHKLFFIGIYQKHYPMGVNEDGEFFAIQENRPVLLGTIEKLCGVNPAKAPVEHATIDIMGKKLPIVIPILYKFGLTKLLAALKPQYYRTVEAGKHLKLQEHEYSIPFNDFHLVLSKRDRMTALILSGLKRCDTSACSIYDLNRKEIYFNLLDSIKIPGRYVKEIELYSQMFVDPITERILIQMGEPTDFTGLLIRCVELLLTRYHRPEVDMTGQRIRGYERMAGEVYTQLVRALREHNRHGIKANYPIELNPEAVWMSIMKDTTKQITSKLNPIQDVKQQDLITFAGNGGRGKQSMVKRTRIHHKTSIGVVSEGTVDSSDAGVTTYLSANPKLTGLYGLTDNTGTGEMNQDLKPENVLSVNAMMTPAIDTDDPKRQVFSGVQQSHTLSASNYRSLPVRTGYDQKLFARQTDMFGASAEDEGVVEEVSSYAIKVRYKNGKIRTVELGQQFGHDGSLTVPHEIVTNLKVGAKVKKGDVLAYNSGFWEPDQTYPGQLAYRYGLLARIAIMENPYTFEDSTAVSKSLADKTQLKTTYVKEVVVDFGQSIHKLAKPGTELKVDDPLCYIEDSITSDSGMFDENSIDLLRNLSKSSPRSPVIGRVDKVEIFYNGDKEDMSESLRKLANMSDTVLVNRQKALGKKAYTGEVDETYRVDGNPLGLNQAVIVFNITTEQGLTSGDRN